MNRSSLAALSLAPLLGASQTLLQATTMAALSIMAIVVHRALMLPLRRQLDATCTVIASVLLAATVVTCQTLALHAWALELRQAMGIYPELIAVSCLLVEQRLGAPTQWRRLGLLLAGYGALFLLLGACRELLANGSLRLASLAPGALMLLGVLLALIKRACPKQAAPTVKETAER